MPTDEAVQAVQYSVTDAEIAAIREKCLALTASTPQGYEEVRVALGTLRDTRVAVERRRVELKADALAWGRKVDSEAKRITDLLTAIETPLKRQKESVDDERARLKAEKEQAELRAIEERMRADMEAEEATRRAAAEAEEAAARATRDAEQARLTEERARLDAERRQFEEERQRAADAQRVAEEQDRIAREAEQVRLKAERDALDEQRRALAAEQERIAQVERDRMAAAKAEQDALAQAERDRVAAAERAARLDALRPDADHLLAFASLLRSLPWPPMRTAESEAILAVAVAGLSRVALELEQAIAEAVA